MKLKRPLILLLIITAVGCMSFLIPNKLQKKVAKEIKQTFKIESYSLASIAVNKEVNNKLKLKITDKNFFKIVKNNQLIGYAFIDKAPSKTDEFDYLVLFDKNLVLKKAKILIYREDYGGEIGSKRWLKQFAGKTSSDRLKYEKDIVAISGATISANSMTVAVNNLLISIDILHKHKII